MSELTEEQIEQRRREAVLLGLADVEAQDDSQWWWLSFADPDLPEGTQFLGAALVPALTIEGAITQAHLLGINPGGQVASWGPIPEDAIPDSHPRCVLMDRETVERFGSA